MGYTTTITFNNGLIFEKSTGSPRIRVGSKDNYVALSENDVEEFSRVIDNWLSGDRDYKRHCYECAEVTTDHLWVMTYSHTIDLQMSGMPRLFIEHDDLVELQTAFVKFK